MKKYGMVWRKKPHSTRNMPVLDFCHHLILQSMFWVTGLLRSVGSLVRIRNRDGGLVLKCRNVALDRSDEGHSFSPWERRGGEKLRSLKATHSTRSQSCKTRQQSLDILLLESYGLCESWLQELCWGLGFVVGIWERFRCCNSYVFCHGAWCVLLW